MALSPDEGAPSPFPPPGIPEVSAPPLPVGVPTAISVTGAVPGEDVFLVLGVRGLGVGHCPLPLGGLCFDLLEPLPLGAEEVDPLGVAEFSLTIPRTVRPGREVCFQAAASRGPGGIDSELSPVACNLTEEGVPLLDLADAEARLVGQVDDGAGWSVSGAGDVDGDGFDDLLVGAPGAPGTPWGGAYLLRGPVTGELDLSTADATFEAERENDDAGSSVSSAGDVDGDGFDDLLIGASGNAPKGAAYYIRGPVSGIIDLATATTKLLGEEVGDIAGYSVSNAGDVDGDGFDDLLIGDHRLGGSDAGAVYLVQNPIAGSLDLSLAAARLIGESADDYAGRSVSGAGDVDADGLDDVLVGADGDATRGLETGAAYLLLGPISGTVDLGTADAKLVGERLADQAGYAVSGAGDVNGDGFDDLLVGAHDNDLGAGAGYLVLGPPMGLVDLGAADAKLAGEQYNDRAGWSVSGPGDVDGDGFDDLLVGAPEEDSRGSDAGAAYLVHGPVFGMVHLSTAAVKLVGEAPVDEAGAAVSGAGDLDGDGLVDVVIGAALHDAASADSGAAYVFYGG